MPSAWIQSSRRPAGRVVEVLVLFFLDFFVRFLERRAHLALRLLGELADQLPVQVILGLGEHDALGGDELRRLRLAGIEGHVHRLDERLADVPDHEPAGRLRLRIETEAREDLLHDAHVVLRLLEVFLPLLLEVVVHDAAKGGRVDVDPPQFGLQGLVQKLADLFVLHEDLLRESDYLGRCSGRRQAGGVRNP